jgi:hypothetical protein
VKPTAGAAAPSLEPVKTIRSSGWLRTNEAPAYLAARLDVKIAARTIQAWCHRRTGALPHLRLGGRILVRADQLLDYINRGAIVSAPVDGTGEEESP